MTRSTALTGFLNCNGVAESLEEIPVNSAICGVDEFLDCSWVPYESEQTKCVAEMQC